MGTCYHLYLYDEHQWSYTNLQKEDVISQVKTVCSYAELIADIPGLMIFDVDKTPPWEFLDKNITCDAMMFTSDHQLTPKMVTRPFLYSPVTIAECAGGPCQYGPEYCDCGSLAIACKS